MKSKYFNNINCIEELKKQYFALAKKYHSDITGGSDEEMKLVNAEYDELFKRYKDVHQSIRDDKEETPYYTAAESTTEAPEDFRNIIEQLLKLKGLNVELCGRWIWISGNTKDHKDALKAMGCRWSSNKKMWSWHHQDEQSGYRRRGKTTMSDIRNRYGSVSFVASEELLLA